ncbi:MAG: AAA family ATPase [Anaerolineae bacterium]|nr:AAA family ATPase [Anaerolineae bacterium]
MSLSAQHLPVALTPFVGRETDLAEIARLLTDPACRLLTLVGPGGIGKTRLSQEAARQNLHLFHDGVYFVGLQALSSPDFIVSAMADALEYEISPHDPQDQLLDFLQTQNLLLVMDNFEHLLAGVSIISDLLASAPHIKILATSREKLNIQGEWVLPITGLNFPTNGHHHDNPLNYCALALFEQSARRVKTDFSLTDELDGVIKICSLVEGMPLAIEFAATWVNTLPCHEIASEIQRSLDFLKSRTRGVEQRHTSMRAVLDYSWNLLSEPEQTIFKQLSVFRGSFTRQAAADVAGATLANLSSLIDKSLVRRDNTGRYDIHELVRQYAEQHLNAEVDDSMAARIQHVRHYTGLLHRLEADLFGAHPQKAMREIEREIKNIRVAWGWAAVLTLTNELEQGMETLWFFYDTRGWYREGEKMLSLAVDVLRNDDDHRQLFGKLITRQGVLSSSLNQFEQAEAQLEEGLTIAREFNEPDETAFTLVRWGTLAVFRGYFEEALHHMDEALAIYNTIDDPWNKAYTLNWLGLLYGQRDYVDQSQELFRQLNSRWGSAIVTTSQAYFALNTQDFDTAKSLAEQGLTACQEIGIRWGVAMSYEALGFVNLGCHEYQEAQRNFREMLHIAIDAQLPRYMVTAAIGAGRALVGLGEEALGQRFLSAAYRYYENLGRKPAYVDFDHTISVELLNTIVTQSTQILDPVETIKTLADDLEHHLQTHQMESPSATDLGELTEREVEVLNLAAQGMTNRDIADELILSVGTVKWYLSQIYSKFGVNNRTHAVARARELGLLT